MLCGIIIIVSVRSGWPIKYQAHNLTILFQPQSITFKVIQKHIAEPIGYILTER
ncbi:hypothetical protein VCR15J2_20133 [Vibrio coralliirubri]|nr:hypothetical protein VCR15J2_20133 [Vibrio coralliirubri]